MDFKGRMKHKILWIGFGNFAKKLKLAIDARTQADIIYFHPDQKKSLERFKDKACWDLYDGLSDTKVSAVFITTPHDSHAFYLAHCLLAHKNVFIEKPITASYSEAEQLLDLLKKNKKVLMVGHNKRRESAIRKAKELISTKTIGDVISIYANDSKGIAYQMDQTNWRFQKSRHREGPLITVGIHLIEAIHYLLGPIDSVSCVLKNISSKSEVPDSNATMLNLKRGTTAFIEANYNMPSVDVFNIYGTEGVINIIGEKLWLRKGRDINRVPTSTAPVNLAPVDTVAEEINEFFNALEGKRKNVETSYREALNALAVIEACWQSSEQKRIVEMTELKQYIT